VEIYVPPKRRLNSARFYGFMFQKMLLYLFTDISYIDVNLNAHAYNIKIYFFMKIEIYNLRIKV
jgi:hypothetical protein